MPAQNNNISENLNFNSLIPTLTVKGAADAIELYKKAFGATEEYRMNCADTGKIMHASLQIGNSRLFVADAAPEAGCATPTSSTFYLYVKDVDQNFKQAKQAGLEEVFPVTDMFWGDRTGSMKDRFGNRWTIATHTRDVSKEEMEEGRKKFEAQMKAKAKAA